MTEHAFYHCTRTAPDAALPRLLGRAMAAGERAVVRSTSPERVKSLDEALWACAEPDWLPHGADEDADLQPIWLTCADENPNGARLIFLLDGAEAELAGFARALDLFDGNDPEQTARARLRWKATREAGHAPIYWQQGERGWEKRGV